MPSILLFFVDGLGIGSRGTQNPLDGLTRAEPLAVFQDETPVPIFDGVMVPTDACLGVSGRPQSASGQTTILTGVNAPAILGGHQPGFPNQALRNILSELSLFLQLKNAGIGPLTFANAYTPDYFSPRPRWVSATTCAVEAAGITFRTLDDILAGNAVFQDYSNQLIIDRGLPFPFHSPEHAGHVLANLTKKHSFTLYEYFITDKTGHSQDFVKARRVLLGLACFVRAVLANLDLSQSTVILTSDHGNIEDLSTRNHTINHVPTWLWGPHRQQLAGRISSLADITPAIVELAVKLKGKSQKDS